MSLFKLGKTKLFHRKSTQGLKAVSVNIPESVTLLMSQHIGNPATPTVSVGDKVYVGTKIAEADGALSSPVHSSVSGTVKKIEDYLLESGKTTKAVIIESDGLSTLDQSIAPISVTSKDELINAARESGVVGLGGAGFPTAVKLAPKNPDEIDTLLINGAECEPYITSDTHTMLDCSEDLRRGIELIMAVLGIKNAVIGIEKNKKEAIKHISGVFAASPSVNVSVLPERYPQGAEKVLIYNTLGRVVPENGLPSDVGVIVLNVTTVASLMRYISTGIPLVEKCITLDGPAVREPKNMIVPIGMKIADVIEQGGGLKKEACKILYGGPMMGIAVYSLDAPVLKNTNALIVLDEKSAKADDSTACIHCGRCVAACPIGLNPTVFAKALDLDDKAEMAARLEENSLNLCMNCGCCSYVCPAKRPLAEKNRLAKSALGAYRNKTK